MPDPRSAFHSATLSSAVIQKTATDITFSNPSLLLTLFCPEVFQITVIASQQHCVNMVFSADDKVLIKSLYQSATELVQTFD